MSDDGSDTEEDKSGKAEWFHHDIPDAMADKERPVGEGSSWYLALVVSHAP
jgi:hypothetical protein